MSRAQIAEFGERELAALNKNAEASFVLDEDAWEEAIDESDVDCDLLCHSQWRSSSPSSID